MSVHKNTKVAIVSGFRTVDDRLLLVSHLVTLTHTLIRKVLVHTRTRGVFMNANSDIVILHIYVAVSQV
jgi:hypothetical protein